LQNKGILVSFGLKEAVKRISAETDCLCANPPKSGRIRSIGPVVTGSADDPSSQGKATVTGVSLFVGGVCVANTMVVAVLERRSEIGLRRALGASRRHITAQFLTEATFLAVCGGAVGSLWACWHKHSPR
jgi:hypothetical protein